MTSFVVDSWAWIEYLRGAESGKRVREEIEKGTALMTSSVTVAEVISKFRREHLDVDGAYRSITGSSRIARIDELDAKDAGVLHASLKDLRRNLSLADAIVLSLARKTKAKVLTGDPDFRGLHEAEMIG